MSLISKEKLTSYLQAAMPDADVTVFDKTGTMDHYRVSVVSDVFQNKNRLDRQRLVYTALSEPMRDGRIHALEIQSQTFEEAGVRTLP